MNQKITLLHALVALVIIMAVLLVTGTVYAFARPVSRHKPSAAETAQTTETPDDRVFTGIGRLRIPLSNTSTLILSVAFPYSPGDLAFTEELAGKVGGFRAIAIDYFASLPADQLADSASLDEPAAKAEILRRYNSGLRLGKIETLYFSDLMIIDGNL